MTHHTADATLKVLDTGSKHTNLGATGAITLNLPLNAPKGTYYEFFVAAAQTVEVACDGNEVFIINGTTSGGGESAAANDEGETLKVTSSGSGHWLCTVTGTWTVS
ncbi:MAG: hypothetical protein AAGH92_08645 [Planctomycetota bacterium]